MAKVVEASADRALRAPLFEGYKLSQGEPVGVTPVLPLGAPLLRQVPPTTPFQLFRRRALHNHLFCGPYRSDVAVYVASTGQLVVAVVAENGAVSVSLSDTVVAKAAEGDEPPSVAFVSADTLLLSSGGGDVQVFRLRENANAQRTLLLTALERPLSILHAALDSTGHLVAAVMTTEHREAPAKQPPASTLAFRTSLLVVDVQQQRCTQLDSPQLLCAEPPALVVVVDAGQTAIVVGSTAAVSVDRGITDMDATPASASAPAPSAKVAPAYSWTQTPDDVTMYFALATPVTKHDVDCRMTSDRIQLVITGGTVANPFMDAKLHASIDVTGSFWTIEKGRLMTLHLEKANAMRWMHVMEHDDNVLETIDPSERAKMLEALEKFTGDDVNEGSGPTTK